MSEEPNTSPNTSLSQNLNPSPPGFGTVLIANRGEIARRIARSCRELGLRVIMIYTPDDCHPELLRLADLCLEIPDTATGSGYLNAPALIAAAREQGAAIHPGYGFLSENTAFASACRDAGVPWIGPSPEVLSLSGDKAACATAMQQAGVSLLPSLACQDDSADTISALTQLGLPLLLKPAHGGGGIGMQLVRELTELPAALASCLEQALRHFGEASVLAERWLPGARHIEVQLLADGQGHLYTLFERECSLQRRRQKVIEEGPSPALTAQQRETLYTLARSAAEAIGLNQLATAEFLFDGQGFWFLEINPRIQVEHAVTEALTGLDLVEWQLRIAQGESLAGFIAPERPQGHAIEARLYAEHPWSGLPAAGELYQLLLPDGQGLRLELGAYPGMRVSADFDPLLLKIIAHGPDRERARLRLLQALRELELSGGAGFATNQPALLAALQDPGFMTGDYDTARFESLVRPAESEPEPALTALIEDLSQQAKRPLARELQPDAANSFWRPAFWT